MTCTSPVLFFKWLSLHTTGTPSLGRRSPYPPPPPPPLVRSTLPVEAEETPRLQLVGPELLNKVKNALPQSTHDCIWSWCDTLIKQYMACTTDRGGGHLTDNQSPNPPAVVRNRGIYSMHGEFEPSRDTDSVHVHFCLYSTFWRYFGTSKSPPWISDVKPIFFQWQMQFVWAAQ